MPWPMPRWVTVSPSHITIAVPAVMVMTTRARRGVSNCTKRSVSKPKLPPPLCMAKPRPVLWTRAMTMVT